jgi:hypothetical protein
MLDVNQLIGFGDRRRSLVTPMTTITQEGSSTSTNSATITAPATIQAGDILILAQYSSSLTSVPTAVFPSGFTTVVNTGGVEARAIISYKIADGSEASAVFTGMDATGTDQFDAKAMYVFRGDAAAVSVTISDVNGEVQTSGNPAAQVKNIASEVAPLVVIGSFGTEPTGTVDPRTWTPGPKDGEINPTNQFYLAYEIFTSGWADTTIDMADEGFGNALQSFYFIPYKAI